MCIILVDLLRLSLLDLQALRILRRFLAGEFMDISAGKARDIVDNRITATSDRLKTCLFLVLDIRLRQTCMSSVIVACSEDVFITDALLYQDKGNVPFEYGLNQVPGTDSIRPRKLLRYRFRCVATRSW